MLQIHTVESATLDILRRLQQVPELNNTRLVGGTGLALHFGHRQSYDIDLFGEIEHDDITGVINEMGFSTFVVNKNSFFMLAKSLTYFEDAEIQEMPVMNQRVIWKDIKNHIRNEIEKL